MNKKNEAKTESENKLSHLSMVMKFLYWHLPLFRPDYLRNYSKSYPKVVVKIRPGPFALSTPETISDAVLGAAIYVATC
jgi:hypothetical protein